MYFCDGNMKTKDNSFHGFPGCWNMVATCDVRDSTKLLDHSVAGYYISYSYVSSIEVYPPPFGLSAGVMPLYL